MHRAGSHAAGGIRPPGARGRGAALGSLAPLLPVVCVAACTGALVVLFDAVLSARVRAQTDNATRLSVILPYAGVGSRYVMARSCGLAALVATGVAVALGIELGRRRALAMPAGEPVSHLHRVIALAGLALVVAHVVLPYTSSVAPSEGWPTSLVPFHQPSYFGHRGVVFESFGIVAMYLMLLLGPSFYLLRRRRWIWRALHPLTAGAYALAVLHALFLGTDFVLRGPTRVALVAVQLPLTLLLARRLAALPDRSPRRTATALALLAAVAVAALSVAGIAGASLGAMSV